MPAWVIDYVLVHELMHRREMTVFASGLEFLTKSIETPPDKFHGLVDPDLRQRMRYLDLVHGEGVLERFVAGDVFHVDSIVWDRQVVFQAMHQYGQPPFQVAHGGGIFTTTSVPKIALPATNVRPTSTVAMTISSTSIARCRRTRLKTTCVTTSQPTRKPASDIQSTCGVSSGRTARFSWPRPGSGSSGRCCRTA